MVLEKMSETASEHRHPDLRLCLVHRRMGEPRLERGLASPGVAGVAALAAGL